MSPSSRPIGGAGLVRSSDVSSDSVASNHPFDFPIMFLRVDDMQCPMSDVEKNPTDLPALRIYRNKDLAISRQGTMSREELIELIAKADRCEYDNFEDC